MCSWILDQATLTVFLRDEKLLHEKLLWRRRSAAYGRLFEMMDLVRSYQFEDYIDRYNLVIKNKSPRYG